MTEEIGTVIPGEPEGGASLNPEIQEQKLKDAAREKGWRPLKEWDGDPAEWVSAKEFLGREKLFKKIHDLQYSLGQQTKRQQDELSQIRKHFEKVRETEYKRAVEDLKAQRKEAILIQDMATVEKIDERLDAVREEQAEAKAEAKAQPVQQGGPTPEFNKWAGDNPWFNKDPEMTQVATEIGVAHAMANPNKPQTDILAYVEQRVKKMFPEKFQSTKRASSPVEGGGSTRMSDSQPNRKGKLSTADLDETEKHVLSTLLKTKTLKTMAEKNKRTETEEYLAQLAEAKGLR